MEKIKLIKVKTQAIGKQLNLKHKNNFTSNKNYLGHTEDDIPVWVDSNMTTEIQEVTDSVFFELPKGFYRDCVITNAYENTRENKNKKEVISKVLEIQVSKFPNEKVYKRFTYEGDLNLQVKSINKEQIEQLKQSYGVSKWEDLIDKKIVVVSKLKVWADNKEHHEITVHNPKDVDDEIKDSEGYIVTNLEWTDIKDYCIFKITVEYGPTTSTQTIYHKRGSEKNHLRDGTEIRSNNEAIEYIKNSYMKGRKLVLKVKNGFKTLKPIK